FQIRNISKLRKMVTYGELEMIVHAFVSSRLDYCNSLFTCLNKREFARLQVVQNSAARLLTCTHRRAPDYIKNLIQPYVSTRSLRSSNLNLLMVPRTLFKTRGDRSFRAVAPRLWNELPCTIRSLDCIDTFRKQLKTHFFKLAF
uniref:Tick transposon n=1 Tax=Poecilia formosa TaxID=48698 RepID=A0A087YEZ4_POEFO